MFATYMLAGTIPQFDPALREWWMAVEFNKTITFRHSSRRVLLTNIGALSPALAFFDCCGPMHQPAF